MSNMASHPPLFYLASQSPRRVELLQQLGFRFEKLCIDIDEQRNPGELPEPFVSRLANEKALAGYACLSDKRPLNSIDSTDNGISNVDRNTENSVILAADTVVAIDDTILGKPSDRAQAEQMLMALSGKTHCVYTGVAVLSKAADAPSYTMQTIVSKTEVRFRTISASEVKWYWESGEPADKAGGYGIQGLGAIFVQSINGSYTGVVGLPVYESCELLKRVGLTPGVFYAQ